MAGFCGGCGSALEDDARFCVGCGQAVAPDPGLPAADAAFHPDSPYPGAPYDPGTLYVPDSPYAPDPGPAAADVSGAPVPYPVAPYTPAPSALPGTYPAEPRPLVTKKRAIVAAIVVGVVAIGYLAWTVISPMLTTPASIADQLVKAAGANDNGAVLALVAPELGASNALDVNRMLDNQTLSPGFQTTSQQGLSATATMHSPKWETIVFTLARPWNGPWRVTRIEMTGSESRTRTNEASLDPEYVEWELWPSNEPEVELTAARDGSSSYTVNRRMVNGEYSETEVGATATVTVQPMPASVFRGTGPDLDTDSESPYAASDPDVTESEAVLSMQLSVYSYDYYETTATLGAKLQCKVRTPMGKVVALGSKTNDGVPDDTSSSYKTVDWTLTPSYLNKHGDKQHPTDGWMAGTYFVVYTVNGKVVACNYWQHVLDE